MIHTAANHPWLTADHGWTLAGTLQVGEPVITATGSTAIVEAVWVIPGSASMWDLTVSNVHDFAVGGGAFVVHNCGDVNPSKVGQHIVSDPDPLNVAADKPNPGSPTYRGQQVDPTSLTANGYTLDPADVRTSPVDSSHRRIGYLSYRDYGGFKDGDWVYKQETWKKLVLSPERS